ncbi:hypothetical protein GCM10009091_26340 [Pseudomonas brenneri]|jgi:hypothetical protein|nr:hypothetical protein GCM10009091_26340 [Pseudomonas brenneri]
MEAIANNPASPQTQSSLQPNDRSQEKGSSTSEVLGSFQVATPEDIASLKQAKLDSDKITY